MGTAKKTRRHAGGDHTLRYSFYILATLVFAIQWIWMFFGHEKLPGTHLHLGIPWEPILPGIAIFAAAYMLAWAAEVAQKDIPPALALALLALVAVLPEYAVDIYFAWVAGKNPEYVQYATANMTGANRLLIGFGWSLIVLVFWLKTRKPEVRLERRLKLETSALLIATLYSLVIPFKKTLSVMDSAFLIAIFLWYFTRLLKGRVEEPEMEGPAELIGAWPPFWRRLAAFSLFAFAGFTIFIAAEPFAEGILAMGRTWGIEEFILVQWLAPLASESPEFIVAVIFAARAIPNASFNTLISSKVNQWTLLVGMLPLAYMVSHGSLHPMELDARQAEEIFLTSAQSLFAVVILSDFRFSVKEAGVLFVLFITQAISPLYEDHLGVDGVHLRYAFAWMYIVFSFILLARSPKLRSQVFGLAGHFFRKS